MIPSIFDLSANDIAREELIRLFMPEVNLLVNKDFQKFLQFCYRIDLSEEKLKKILNNSEPEFLIRDLTAAIVDRQLLKAEMKKKYK
ncbi:MAG TPA: hypothetical protein VK921_06705 [Anditalea sp.]|nr:hypothetical protein [Anditalea sp.]